MFKQSERKKIPVFGLDDSSDILFLPNFWPAGPFVLAYQDYEKAAKIRDELQKMKLS